MDKKIRNLAIGTITIVILIALDQFSKHLAIIYLKPIFPRRIELVGSFLVFVFATNHGAFLSLGNSLAPFMWWISLVILPSLVLLALSVYIIARKLDNNFYLFIWILIMGGGLGNLLNRIPKPHEVIDFINAGIGTLRTGVLNLADLYVTIAFIVIVIKILFPGKVKQA